MVWMQWEVLVTLANVTLGHLQVLAQQWVIFSKDSLPGVYVSFLQVPTVLNFDVLRWVAFDCLRYSENGPFGTTFVFYAVLPIFGILPPLYGLYAFARSRSATLEKKERLSKMEATTDGFHDNPLPLPQPEPEPEPEELDFTRSSAKMSYSVNPLVNPLALDTVNSHVWHRTSSFSVGPFSADDAPSRVTANSLAVRQHATVFSTPEAMKEALAQAKAELEMREGRRAEEADAENVGEGGRGSVGSRGSHRRSQGSTASDHNFASSSLTDLLYRFSTAMSPSASQKNSFRLSARSLIGSRSGSVDSNNWFLSLGNVLGQLTPRDTLAVEKEQPLCESSWRSKWMLKTEVSVDEPSLKQLSSFLGLAVLFLILIHPSVATYMFQLYNCQEIYFENGNRRYWLVEDRVTECYTERWRLMRMASYLVIGGFILGLPLMLWCMCKSMYDMKRVQANGRIDYVPSKRLMAVPVHKTSRDRRTSGASGRSSRLRASELRLGTQHDFFVAINGGDDVVEVTPLWRETGHMQTGLQHPVIDALIGAHIRHFKPTHYYWGLCYEILRRVSVTSMVILVQSPMVFNAPRFDVIFAQLVSVLSLMVQAQVKPYCKSNINLIQTLIVGSQSLTVLVLTTEKYVTDTNVESGVCGWILVVMQLMLFTFIFHNAFQEFVPWIKLFFLQSNRVNGRSSSMKSVPASHRPISLEMSGSAHGNGAST
ncbi:hypothetical protein CYMTET_43539 [Cymbomonas tetramitiformis]|uniref:Uncharacterized protein n=1 Tax=Cymbomonas tetramitiformis TaxID=36881 RepID=A0AAE0C1W9_9CHLO|nr:hypothetical protein CYMTET_43539 [Cymbomonas tetramitiformis]